MSDSLSSSEDELPKCKKKKSNTRRGLTRKSVVTVKTDEVDNITAESNIYTSDLFNSLKSVKSEDLQSKFDKDEDFCSIFHTTSRPVGALDALYFDELPNKEIKRKPITSENIKVASSVNAALIPTSCEVGFSESDYHQLENDEIEGRLSPTPPPRGELKGKWRQKKGVKKAMKSLIKAKDTFGNTSENRDTDVSAKEINSPTKSSACFSREMQIKVQIRSRIQRFDVLFNQPFSSIIEIIAANEYLNKDQVVLFFNDIVIHPWETPLSLDMGIADIIECHIRKPLHPQELFSHHSDDMLYPDDDPEVIVLKIRSKDSSVNLKMRKTETMKQVMRKYAMKFKLEYSTLKFTFDGENINPDDTAKDLELDDNFCIDVLPVQ